MVSTCIPDFSGRCSPGYRSRCRWEARPGPTVNR
jgi:hypothetical protein